MLFQTTWDNRRLGKLWNGQKHMIATGIEVNC